MMRIMSMKEFLRFILHKFHLLVDNHQLHLVHVLLFFPTRIWQQIENKSKIKW